MHAIKVMMKAKIAFILISQKLSVDKQDPILQTQCFPLKHTYIMRPICHCLDITMTKVVSIRVFSKAKSNLLFKEDLSIYINEVARNF